MTRKIVYTVALISTLAGTFDASRCGGHPKLTLVQLLS